MKKNIICAGLLLAGLIVSSCDDMLSTTDPTKIDKNLFFKNAKQFEQAVNGVYGQLQGITNVAYLWGEMASDNTAFDFNPADRGGAAGWEAIEYGTVNPGNGEISGLYNSHYAALYNVNNTLERLAESELEAAVREPFEGQLKFFRAYYYFNLVRYFGDVILLTNTLKSYNDAYDLQRVPQSEIFAQIEKDLTEAVALLPAAYTGQAGRVTKGAALTLLGKVYLTEKKYDDAANTLREVTKLGYSLVPDYADNFNPARKNGPESILEVQYQGDNDLGEQSNFSYVFAPRASGGVVTGWTTVVPSGRNTPTNDMMAAYETGDKRKDISLKSGYTRDGTFFPVPYVNKYNYPHTIAGRTNSNWPVFRYADVLLMLAESINEQAGPTAEALGFMNQVRERAGLKPLSGLSKEAFRTAVMQERRVELAFENHRWFDLKRVMTPVEFAAFMNAHGARERANPTVTRGSIGFSDLDYVFSPFEYLLPIPAQQILINPALSQNEEYK
ncbi:RagB/SusD family nutrient uptake outer membrane protein [Ravibacter arvi]|uniref:RagB/SusD family nutrient uptake outer membrane protein n=1 Tax=Ravibacter arvi TaxID=2051041 RepID=A0ABP8LWQ1_9BACT